MLELIIRTYRVGREAMREDFEEFREVGMEQELHILKSDLKRLRDDISSILWRSTMGQVQRKIYQRPITTVLLAFGAGFIISRFLKKNKSVNQ